MNRRALDYKNVGEFDWYADGYDAALERGIALSGESKSYFARGRVEWLRRRLVEYGEWQRGGMAVLDFGCGTGSATPYFLQWPSVGSVLGIDISRRSLDLAEQRFGSAPGGPRFRLMQEHEPDGSFDLAYSNGVFHHIPVGRRLDAVQYVWRSLRPGGYFALWENNPWNPFTRWVMRRIPFDRSAVLLSPPHARQLVRAAGFEVLETSFQFIFPRGLKWLRFLEPSLAALPLGTQYLVLCRKPVDSV